MWVEAISGEVHGFGNISLCCGRIVGFFLTPFNVKNHLTCLMGGVSPLAASGEE